MKIVLRAVTVFLLLVVTARAATEPEAAAALAAATASQQYCATACAAADTSLGNAFARWDALEVRWQAVKGNASQIQTQQYNGEMVNAMYWMIQGQNCYAYAVNVGITALLGLEVANNQYNRGEYTNCYNTCQTILTNCQQGTMAAGMCVTYCNTTANGHMDAAEAILEQLE